MENLIKISKHINKLIIYFGSYFNHDSVPRNECLKIAEESCLLHHKFVSDRELLSYEKHIALAKNVYGIMLNKFDNKQIVNDIVFCGSTDRSWEETRFLLSNLYEIDMHSHEIYAFYYLYEINKMRYIDSPLPKANPTPP